jgi:hypothetical protein
LGAGDLGMGIDVLQHHLLLLGAARTPEPARSWREPQ